MNKTTEKILTGTLLGELYATNAIIGGPFYAVGSLFVPKGQRWKTFKGLMLPLPDKK